MYADPATDGADGGYTSDPTVPPGYRRDPATGQLVPIAPTFTPDPGHGTAVAPPPTWTPAPGSNPDTLNPDWRAQGGVPAGPDTHWDPARGMFVPNTTTPATGGGSGGGGGPTGTLGGLLAPFTGTFTAPTPTAYPDAPGFHAPTYTPPPKFAAPTGDEVLNDSGYKFAADEGERALAQGHAAGGTLNTGGTLKDILAWGSNYAAQRYGDVYNRDLSTYNTNLQSQYLQPYQFAYQGALDTFNPTQSQWQTKMAATQRGNENTYANAYTSFNDAYNRWRDQRDSTYSKVRDYSTL